MSGPYRILITGSRTWNDRDTLITALTETACLHLPAIIIHGACPTGADTIASQWARQMARVLPLTEERHPAQGHPTEDFGPWPAAGPRRNAHMVSLGADLCLAFIDPCTRPRCREPQPHDSHGTAGTIGLCDAAGIPVQPYRAVEAGAA